MVPRRIAQWWPQLESAAGKWSLDVYLLAAIMDRESLGGIALEPPGPGGTGDHAHGLGLLQIDARAWPAFAAGIMPDGSPEWADPSCNIDMGAQVLASYMTLFGGCEAKAVGAYNAGPHRVREVCMDITRGGPGPPPIEAIIWACDSVTTQQDYVSDVFRRREIFKMPSPPKAAPPPEKP